MNTAKIRFLLAACFLLISVSAFADNTIVRGKVNNPISDSIYITYNDNPIAYYPNNIGARLDKNGNFKLSFQLPADVYTQVQLKYNNRQADMLLQPGDDITPTFDAKHFDSTIHYTGKGSAIQNFIAKHAIEREPMNFFAGKVKPMMAKDSSAFVKAIDKQNDSEMLFLSRNDKDLPPSFVQYWKAFYTYTVYFYKLQYPLIHEMTKQKKYDVGDIPKGNYTAAATVPYAFNDSFMQVTPYLLYLNTIFYEKLKAGGYTFKPDDTLGKQKIEDTVLKLVSKYLPDRSAEYFLAQDLYGKAKYQPLPKTELALSTFNEKWPRSSYTAMLDKQAIIARRLAPGKSAPDFDIATPDGRKMKLSGLKGKVVYLHFWANWCKPCVGEIIDETKMKELLKDKPVDFVYVSLDNDIAKDTAIMKHYKVNGTFTNVDKGWYADVVQAYGVQTLPAYFLINEQGNFALQNAPAPHQETELILAIEKLFK